MRKSDHQPCGAAERLPSMTSMNIRMEGTWGRTRRHGIIAGIIALTWLLAACSAGEAQSDRAEAPAVADGAIPQAASEGDKSADSNRSIITTGSLYLTVDEPMAAADKAAQLVESAGGRVDGRSENAPQGSDGGSAMLTLRIPHDKLDAVVEDLETLGSVDQYSTTSQDVTTEVTDLTARISTLKASTERIERLIKDAQNLADIITLEDELASRQAELESLTAQQRGLDDQVSLATINLSLTTKPAVEVDDSPHSFWDAFGDGWGALIAFLSGALVVFGVLLPWLLLIGAIAAAIILPRRLRRRKSGRRVTPGQGDVTAAAGAPPSPGA